MYVCIYVCMYVMNSPLDLKNIKEVFMYITTVLYLLCMCMYVYVCMCMYVCVCMC